MRTAAARRAAIDQRQHRISGGDSPGTAAPDTRPTVRGSTAPPA
ncbi:hypothetical protein [Nocardiopsis sp. RV163]|nr:hypothetical protein [Nocardiopsis sp. RV163]